MQQHGLDSPDQDLAVPTYHPYNTAMESRRLDYLFTKGLATQGGKVVQGSRHRARSDHDLVTLELPWDPRPIAPRHRPTWGGRRYAKEWTQTAEASQPPTQTDTHQAISQLAQRITEHGRPSQRYRESHEVRALRAQARQATGGNARDLWKRVSRQRKKEFRAWHGELAKQASQANWGAYRAIQQTKARVGWQHALMDDARWQANLTDHFRGIFAKAPAQRTRRRLHDTRQALTKLCKHTQWRPFTGDELQLATRTWQRNKATGPDAITHELLQQLIQVPAWGTRIVHMLNDFLYKGELPAPVQQGMTILLPKTVGDPTTWGDTRPITLSSAILKWFAQLLLLRGGGRLMDHAPLQWAGRGKQAPELLVVLRRVVRHAKEWGVPTWIVKLDVRKAFDSVWQESMGDMVAQRIGGLRQGGGGTEGGMPWEARAWLGLLERERCRCLWGTQ